MDSSGIAVTVKLMNVVCLKSLAAPLLTLAALAWIPLARSQTSSSLTLRTIEVTTGGPVEFTFDDAGTGAASYQAQFSPIVGPGTNWRVSSNAVLTSLGGGSYRVSIPDPQTPVGFYRVVGLSSVGGPVSIEFNSVVFQVVEGSTVLPTLVLNQPFTGTVFYTVGGTAASGDYQELNGQVTVDGAATSIPIRLNDNGVIGQLKTLTLRLEAGPGYQLGGNSQTTITIDENDADWEGTFVSGHSVIPFLIRVTQQAGMPAQAVLTSDPFGFFSTNEVPMILEFTPGTFVASAESIPVPAEATLLGLPLVQKLGLSADSGQPGQEVGPDRIEGSAILITTVSAAMHLNATNHGAFVLSKLPVRPSTNEIQLVQMP